MLKKLLKALGLGGPHRDARALARDARAMVEMVRHQHGPQSLQAIAACVRENIDDVHRRGLDDPTYFSRGIDSLTERNRAARAERDQISWSGITLAIIYIKAEIIGDAANEARAIIDSAVKEWENAG